MQCFFHLIDISLLLTVRCKRQFFLPYHFPAIFGFNQYTNNHQNRIIKTLQLFNPAGKAYTPCNAILTAHLLIRNVAWNVTKAKCSHEFARERKMACMLITTKRLCCNNTQSQSLSHVLYLFPVFIVLMGNKCNHWRRYCWHVGVFYHLCLSQMTQRTHTDMRTQSLRVLAP